MKRPVLSLRQERSEGGREELEEERGEGGEALEEEEELKNMSVRLEDKKKTQ